MSASLAPYLSTLPTLLPKQQVPHASGRPQVQRGVLRSSAPQGLAVAAGIAAFTAETSRRRHQIRCRTTRRAAVTSTVARSAVATAKKTDLKVSAEAATEIVEVEPAKGHAHTCTIIYLHGFAGRGTEYLDQGYCLPWVSGGDRVPGLRAVLPTAPKHRQPWGPIAHAWYTYERPDRNHVGDTATLDFSRRWISELVREEIRRLGGAAHKVFLGGLSQGCTVALDCYLREGRKLGLGGFVGSVGFMPSDLYGFSGASMALENLIADKSQGSRPVWLQCATDDRCEVPWRSVVKPSLRKGEGRLPGLRIRLVQGRGHCIDEWEGHILNDFLKATGCKG